MVEKILAIKFKYLGDVVVMIPALRALRQHYEGAELHVLVPAEAVPLLQGIPWLDKVWAFKRERGKAKLSESLPIVQALRAEKFSRSVDFVGNDRGALLSRLVGAPVRLGQRPIGSRSTRRLCYTETVEELDTTRHEVIRDFFVLTPWQVAPPASWEPVLAKPSKPSQLPEGTILCHLSTSQRKKEPSRNTWIALGKALVDAGFTVCFSSGPSQREQELLTALYEAWPEATIMPLSDSLEDYMALLSGARLFISPDTAPLHIAAGLGVPTVGLFGPTEPSRWAPVSQKSVTLKGSLCPCDAHKHECTLSKRCLDKITAMDIFKKAQEMLAYE